MAFFVSIAIALAIANANEFVAGYYHYQQQQILFIMLSIPIFYNMLPRPTHDIKQDSNDKSQLKEDSSSATSSLDTRLALPCNALRRSLQPSNQQLRLEVQLTLSLEE